MALLTTNALTKYYGGDEIFYDISVEIHEESRIALVGPNGAGKTTLINLLLDFESPTDGEITRKKNLQMGFLPQRPELLTGRTVWEEMMTAFESLHALESRLKELEEAMANPDRVDEQEELLEIYGKLQHRFEYRGGYDYENETRRVLHGLGFEPEDYDKRIEILSGGQKTRVLLARLLLEKPDLLVLDEPTNHLDINAVEWLESYLRGWEGAVLIVSHDRYFMDKTANIVWELNFGELEVYQGNYSHYVHQRKERHERRLKEYEAQQAYIKKEMEYIEKNIAGQNTRQAQGRRRRLERMMSGTDRHGRAVDDPWLIRKPFTDKPDMNIQLNATRTGNNVLRTKGMLIGYSQDEPLFEAPEILLLRGEVAAIIGPNGVGKSTFLKSILGDLDPLAGDYEWGARVKIGYFAQAHEGLDPTKTIVDELLEAKFMETSRARNYLAQYLFTGEDVFRKVSTLSGGERGRLALAKLSLQGANVLLLDEPTNHLDIPSQEILEEVLNHFQGTILMVSHDRYFVSALATQIWSIQHDEMRVFSGKYEAFLADREERRLATIAEREQKESNGQSSDDQNNKSNKPSHGLSPYKAKKLLEKLEKEIHKLEQEMDDIMAEINVASEQGDVETVTKLGERYSEIEAGLNEKMEQWSELA